MTTIDAALRPAPDDTKYTVNNRLEVVSVLRALKHRKALVAAYLESDEDFILTSILSLEPECDEIVLAYGTRPELNTSMLAAVRVTCITTQEGIKVRFDLETVKRGLFDGYEAFCASVPVTLQRVQRRDYYRVTTPIANPLKCVIPIGTKQHTAAELIVMDLSAGGLGVMDHHHLVHLEPGNLYRACRMVLPGVGTVYFDLEVKTSFEVTLMSGVSCKRSGCEFVDLPALTEGAIQRYIMQLERERNARVRR